MRDNKKDINFATAFRPFKQGEMVEWSITTVLKTVVLRGTGGSNPSLSAKKEKFEAGFLFFCTYFFASCLLNDKVPGILFHFLLMTNFMGLPDWCFHV